MRSKLEVSWARFFDQHGVFWCYEPERFAFDNGYQYVPDFLLTDFNQFFEAKGVMTSIDLYKIELLVKKTRRQLVVGYGDGHIEMYYLNPRGLLTKSAEVRFARCQECGKAQFWLNSQLACLFCGNEDAKPERIRIWW